MIPMKYLNLVHRRDLFNWSVAYHLGIGHSYSDKYPLVALGVFLYRSRNIIDVKDDIVYKRVSISTIGKGVSVRDERQGKKIGTKKQYRINSGQFLVSKIDARNGAFGVVPLEAENAIITGNFWAYDVDYNLIDPHYLALITRTQEFTSFCEKASNGTTNRHYLQESLFLSQKIPLPSLEEQNKIIATYNATIAQAKQYSTQAKDIDEQIEKYWQDELGMPSLQDECKNIVFRDTPYKFLRLHRLNDMSDRWDLYNTLHSIFDVFKKSQYPVKQIGDVFEFVTRGWKKVGDEFNYIEIGDVVPILGIIGKQKLKVKKAPSRATQVVKTGDLIIGTTRPYLKRFAIVNEDYNNDICSSGFQVVESKNDYNIKYLLEFLLTSYAVEQFEYYMTGALYPAITSKDLRKIQIPLPPRHIQNEIVEHIDVLRKEQKDLQQKALTLRQQATQQFEQIIFA